MNKKGIDIQTIFYVLIGFFAVRLITYLSSSDRLVDKKLSDLEKQFKPTYDSYDYLKFADKLETAMSGAGTDEDAIFSVFYLMKNDLDIFKLVQSFGTRSSYLSSGNLDQWINDDLSSEYLTKLNNVLAKKGIKYRF
jgi:hypothetical protein